MVLPSTGTRIKRKIEDLNLEEEPTSAMKKKAEEKRKMAEKPAMKTTPDALKKQKESGDPFGTYAMFCFTRGETSEIKEIQAARDSELDEKLEVIENAITNQDVKIAAIEDSVSGVKLGEKLQELLPAALENMGITAASKSNVEQDKPSFSEIMKLQEAGASNTAPAASFADIYRMTQPDRGKLTSGQKSLISEHNRGVVLSPINDYHLEDTKQQLIAEGNSTVSRENCLHRAVLEFLYKEVGIEYRELDKMEIASLSTQDNMPGKIVVVFKEEESVKNIFAGLRINKPAKDIQVSPWIPTEMMERYREVKDAERAHMKTLNSRHERGGPKMRTRVILDEGDFRVEEAEDKDRQRRIWRPSSIWIKSGPLFRKERKKIRFVKEKPEGRRQLTDSEKKKVAEKAEQSRKRYRERDVSSDEEDHTEVVSTEF